MADFDYKVGGAQVEAPVVNVDIKPSNVASDLQAMMITGMKGYATMQTQDKADEKAQMTSDLSDINLATTEKLNNTFNANDMNTILTDYDTQVSQLAGKYKNEETRLALNVSSNSFQIGQKRIVSYANKKLLNDKILTDVVNTTTTGLNSWFTNAEGNSFILDLKTHADSLVNNGLASRKAANNEVLANVASTLQHSLPADANFKQLQEVKAKIDRFADEFDPKLKTQDNYNTTIGTINNLLATRAKSDISETNAWLQTNDKTKAFSGIDSLVEDKIITKDLGEAKKKIWFESNKSRLLLEEERAKIQASRGMYIYDSASKQGKDQLKTLWTQALMRTTSDGKASEPDIEVLNYAMEHNSNAFKTHTSTVMTEFMNKALISDAPFSAKIDFINEKYTHFTGQYQDFIGEGIKEKVGVLNAINNMTIGNKEAVYSKYMTNKAMGNDLPPVNLTDDQRDTINEELVDPTAIANFKKELRIAASADIPVEAYMESNLQRFGIKDLGNSRISSSAKSKLFSDKTTENVNMGDWMDKSMNLYAEAVRQGNFGTNTKAMDNLLASGDITVVDSKIPGFVTFMNEDRTQELSVRVDDFQFVKKVALTELVKSKETYLNDVVNKIVDNLSEGMKAEVDSPLLDIITTPIKGTYNALSPTGSNIGKLWDLNVKKLNDWNKKGAIQESDSELINRLSKGAK